MKKFKSFIPFLAAAGLTIGLAGCEISSDTVIRDVAISVAGTYENGGRSIVTRQSGGAVTFLAVRQNGDQLSAVDNHGIHFSGTLTEAASASAATFELEGKSSAGVEVTISGTFSIGGNTSTMRGTWIEPAIVGAVFGTAQVYVPSDTSTPTNVTALLQ